MNYKHNGLRPVTEGQPMNEQSKLIIGLHPPNVSVPYCLGITILQNYLQPPADFHIVYRRQFTVEKDRS